MHRWLQESRAPARTSRRGWQVQIPAGQAQVRALESETVCEWECEQEMVHEQAMVRQQLEQGRRQVKEECRTWRRPRREPNFVAFPC